MKERIQRLFVGRQGMDELSKTMFWGSLVSIILASLIGGLLNGVLSTLLLWLGFMLLILCFVRAFSKNLCQRETENAAYINYLAKLHRRWDAAKDRRSQSGEFKFFKCPGCGAYLRVPRGKGKIHINCKCGYMMYRDT